ncbi:MAG: stage V sporulation protein AC [Halothermotrichaceae bacterium]
MANINKDKERYKKVLKKNKTSPNKIINIFKAFVIGGSICLVGQGFWNLYLGITSLNQDDAGALATITMIFLGGLLTGLGLYDEFGQFAGAGSIVPVTGFANSMVSPAMEYKQEGYILGVGAELFSVAGPVLTYGMISAFIVGAIKEIVG